jgi:hypothetical protein
LPGEQAPKAGGARFPVWLAAAAIALAVLLAVNELLLARLSWAPDAKAAA